MNQPAGVWMAKTCPQPWHAYAVMQEALGSVVNHGRLD